MSFFRHIYNSKNTILLCQKFTTYVQKYIVQMSIDGKIAIKFCHRLIWIRGTCVKFIELPGPRPVNSTDKLLWEMKIEMIDVEKKKDRKVELVRAKFHLWPIQVQVGNFYKCLHKMEKRAKYKLQL